MKHISADVNTDIHTKLIKIFILWLENGSNGSALWNQLWKGGAKVT